MSRITHLQVYRNRNGVWVWSYELDGHIVQSTVWRAGHHTTERDAKRALHDHLVKRGLVLEHLQ